MPQASAYTIEPATHDHVPHLAAHLRLADRLEVRASHGHTPEEALRDSLDCSAKAWTLLVENAGFSHFLPAAMWGVAPAGGPLSFTGRPWLLATPALHAVDRQFIRQSRHYVAAMQAAFPRLENWCYAGNALSLRWLTWCGFTVERDKPVSFRGEPFYFFWKEAYHA